MTPLPAPFRVNGTLVDPSLNRITPPSGDTVQVEPKIMQVLTVLAEHPQRLVTREELMQRVWSGVFVTDDALHRAIRELRRLFGDDAEAPQVIETIRKRGYRLIAPVEPADAGQVGPTEAVGTAGRAGTEQPGRAGWAVWARRGGTGRKGAIALAALIIAGVAVALWTASRPGSLQTEAHVRFTPLTSEPGNEIDPALSSSGRLAYVARGDDGRPHLFARAAADAPPVQITRGASSDFAPTWSPDESRLAFVRTDASSCAIWIAAADGREARVLAPCASTDEFRMSWSPDGTWLAVTAGRVSMRAPSHIETISIATGERRTISAPPPAHSGDWSPAFSPDGREIAFVRSISGSISDVFVAPAAGGQPHRVTADNADVLGVDWDADGRHLVFSSDRAGGISVWRVPSAGGEPSLLAGGGAKLKHPSVSRRSGLVAYEDWQYEINLREQPAVEDESQSSTPISPTGDRWNFHPQISPDGRHLVFQSTRSGQYELWLSDRDGSNARPLTRSGVYKSPARWSPDSRRLAFTTRRGGMTDLSVLDVATGAIRSLVTDSSAAVAPAWSADGASLYFGSLRSGSWQIWNAEASTGGVRQVTNDGGYAAIASPDGRWLYISRLDRPGLWRRPISGGPESLIVDRVLAEQWPNWGTYDRGVYFLTWPDAGDPCLAVVEDGSPAPRLLARLPDFAWSGIAVTRDASRVIYAHADRRASNIGSVQAVP
jgi:Tol biopolymer transport system component/DNA-binding winged helix-turn-helix (wHTH) protein